MLSDINLEKFKDIHWKTQDSTEDSILFYRIGPDAKALHDFQERIQNCSYGWLVVNRPVDSLPARTSVVPDNDWPELQKQILERYYPMPHLRLIALTGTNGKTTTTDLVLQLATSIGMRGFSIGTLGVRENGRTIEDFGLTSPSFIDLRKFLFRYGKGKDFCVLEASSHALAQERLYGLRFDGAGWLSFSQDHLDYHKTMDDYFAAKAQIFNKLKPGAKVFVPDEQEALFSKLHKFSNRAVKAPVISVELPLFFNTVFNKNNLEVAAAIVETVFNTVLPANFDHLQAPDGRFFIRPFRTNFIVVDFAHTPDALENVCRGIRKSYPSHRLKVLFGCGGDRDRAKRPLMATVVESWADHIYVTSDNPRTEDPEQIIDDIIKGIKHKRYTRIVERPKAVQLAFSELSENEILLLAGKGHEDYILIHGVKHPYSDIREVEQFLRKNP